MNNREKLSIQRQGSPVLAVRRPFSLFSHLMDEFFDEVVLPGSNETFGIQPKIDLIDKENHFVVQAELPGVDKKDLEIDLNEDSLILKGEKKMCNEHKEGKYYYRESSYGKFMRQIPFPEKVNTEQAKASFDNGILKIELPKAELIKTRKLELE